MDFRTWVDKNAVSLKLMAEKSGISQGTLQRVYDGWQPRLSNALAINKFTDGQVTLEEIAQLKVGEYMCYIEEKRKKKKEEREKEEKVNRKPKISKAKEAI